jgi:hypothetical protein
MEDLKTVQFPALIDLLAHYTSRYSSLMVKGDRWQEFEDSKKIIKLIHAEIESRKQQSLHSSPDPAS